MAALFDEACQQPAPDRRAWLDRTCDDAEVRAEVGAMLDAFERDPEYLEAGVDAGAVERAVADQLAGRRLGAYRLVRPVGRGGMGVVYEAVRDDEEFDRRAAVKVLPAWRAAVFGERFRFERRVLAGLDHPGIARLLDAGTTPDGLPYYVMEFVDGAPIDAWCRSGPAPLVERVRLFEQVCAAVAYAHAHLVVHRDLKPANILVTADGRPKLLDFGIAALVGGDGASAGLTRTGQHTFTPEFASPEQVRGERVTTASDVYSLGVLLYLLLADERPYDLRALSPLEALRTVCEVDPPPPSTVASAGVRATLTGDLDTIVMKALRKAPGDRYPTVIALADDLRAWRERRPIAAAPASMAYLASRFVRRNRVMVSVAAAATAALVVGGSVAVWQGRVARRERALAEARFQEVRALANAVVGPLYDAIADVPGTTAARQLLVQEALTYLDRLAAQSTGDLALKAELADAYRKIGDVQGNHLDANLGDLRAAAASYQKLVALRREVYDARPADPAARLALADAELCIADLLLGENRTSEAVAAYERVLTVLGPLTPSTDDATVVLAARAQRRAATATSWAGRYDDAIARFDRTIALLEPRATAPDASDEVRAALSTTVQNSGDAFFYAGRHADAAARYEAALAMARQRVGARTDLPSRREVYLAAMRVAAAVKELGRLDEAAALEREAIGIMEALEALDPRNVGVRFDRATTLQNLAITSMRRREYREARAAARASLALFERTLADSPDARQWHFDYGATHVTLGQIELADRRPAAAREAFRKALESLRDPEVSARMPSMRLDALEGLGDAAAALARTAGDTALREEARGAYRDAAAGFADLVSRGGQAPALESRPDEIQRKLALVADGRP